MYVGVLFVNSYLICSGLIGNFLFNYSTMDSFEALLDENVEVNENNIPPNEIEEDEPNKSERPNKRSRNLPCGVRNFLTKLLNILMEN